jgi:zearalenone synthase (highly reducing iterative type I polyketide synthase)
MPASDVDPCRPPYRYGAGSLVALEVRNWISREMKANMAFLEILAAVPIESFAAKVAEYISYLVEACLLASNLV